MTEQVRPRHRRSIFEILVNYRSFIERPEQQRKNTSGRYQSGSVLLEGKLIESQLSDLWNSRRRFRGTVYCIILVQNGWECPYVWVLVPRTPGRILRRMVFLL